MRKLIVPAVLAALALPAAAQEEAAAPAERLAGLLEELTGLGDDAWTARTAALKERIAAHRARMAKLEAEAKALQEKARAEARRAEALEAEIANLDKLRSLLREHPVVGAAAGKEKATAAMADAGTEEKEPAEGAGEPAEKTPPEKKTKKEAGASAGSEGAMKKEKEKKEGNDGDGGSGETTKKEKMAGGAGSPGKAMKEEKKKEAGDSAKEKEDEGKPKDSGENASPAGDGQDVVAWDHVADLLLENCSTCHDPVDRSGGLDVTSFAAIREGGSSGRTIEPGNARGSRLYRLVARLEKPFMPQDMDPLKKEQIRLIARWIDHGAARTEEDARRFLAEKAEAEEKAAAEAAAAEAALAEGTPPLPAGDLPDIALARPERAPPLATLARSPRAPLVALPGMGQVLLYDEDLKLLAVLPSVLEEITSLSFSPDGEWLVAAGGTPGRRGGAELFEVRSGASLGRFGRLADTALAAAAHHGLGLVAVGGGNRRLDVIEVASAETRYRVEGHADWVLSCAFSPDGGLLASAGRAGRLLLKEAETGRDAHALKGHQGAVHAVAFDRGSRWLASAGLDGTVRTWDVRSGKPRWSQRGHAGGALAVSWSSGHLASGGRDGRLRLWKDDGGTRTRTPDLGDWIYGVGVLDDGGRLLAADARGRVHRYLLEKKEVAGAVTPLARPLTQ